MKRGLFIVGLTILFGLVVSGGAVAGYYFFVMPNAQAPLVQVTMEERRGAGPGSDTPELETIYFQTKNFVTDLADRDRPRYVDVTVALAMEDEAAVELAKQAEPQIRDLILSQLRVRQAQELAGAAGKDALARSLQQQLDRLLPGKVRRVFITDLVIQ